MAFKGIHNHNPFVLPSILLGVFLFCKYYFSRQPGRFRPFFNRFGTKSTSVVAVAFCVSLFLVPVFEAYFTIYRCSVSDRYYQENVELAQNVIGVLMKFSLPFWLDYATLLCYLRAQEINPWDHDVDLSMIHPAYLSKLYESKVPLVNGSPVSALPPVEESIAAAAASSIAPETLSVGAGAGEEATSSPSDPAPSSAKESLSSLLSSASSHSSSNTATLSTHERPAAESVEELQKLFEAEGLKTSWDEERDLFQIWGAKGNGPHIDLWLWRPALSLQKDNEGPYPKHSELSYTSRDHTIAYNMRTQTDLFPLQNSTWLGIPVYTPADSHHVSHLEFDHYGGSYMQSQVFRGDCFHNFFNARFAY